MQAADASATSPLPTFRQYCFSCHSNAAKMAGISLEQLTGEPSVGENFQQWEKIASALAEEGFDVRAIRPPSVPSGTARLRLSVNAGVDPATIERFAGILSGVIARFTPCSVASS